jgi:hypothetical protein
VQSSALFSPDLSEPDKSGYFTISICFVFINIKRKMNSIIRGLFLTCCIFIYIISLTQTAFYYFDYSTSVDAFSALYLGWFTLIIGDGAAISWLANPSIFIAWIIFLKSPRRSLLFSIAATLFSISFLFFKEVTTDEGGGRSEIVRCGTGYWLWLLSCFTMVLGSIFYMVFFNRRTND